jgi:hypothetical protein
LPGARRSGKPLTGGQTGLDICLAAQSGPEAGKPSHHIDKKHEKKIVTASAIPRA